MEQRQENDERKIGVCASDTITRNRSSLPEGFQEEKKHPTNYG